MKRSWIMVLALGAAVSAQGATVFEREVWPILEAKCLNCHRAPYQDERGRTRKPKGDLRLDGAGWILTGGTEGASVVRGDPDASPLYQRVALPDEDDDRMPAKGDPLSAEEKQVLAAWIAGGASFGGWVGEPGPEAAATEQPTRVLEMQALAEGLRPAAPAAIQRAAGDLGQIEPAQPGSPLLRVSYLSSESDVDDRVVAALGDIREQVVYLNLARTQVSDRCVVTIQQLKRLMSLDARNTGVGDRFATAASGLPELRYLNLYGTQVTDVGLEKLGKAPKLRAVYLWKTQVTREGVEAFRKARPEVRLVWQRPLPEVPAPDDSRDSRRRR